MKRRNRTEELLKSGNTDENLNNPNNTPGKSSESGQTVHKPNSSQIKAKEEVFGKKQNPAVHKSPTNMKKKPKPGKKKAKSKEVKIAGTAAGALVIVGTGVAVANNINKNDNHTPDNNKADESGLDFDKDTKKKSSKKDGEEFNLKNDKNDSKKEKQHKKRNKSKSEDALNDLLNGGSSSSDDEPTTSSDPLESLLGSGSKTLDQLADKAKSSVSLASKLGGSKNEKAKAKPEKIPNAIKDNNSKDKDNGDKTDRKSVV